MSPLEQIVKRTLAAARNPNATRFDLEARELEQICELATFALDVMRFAQTRDAYAQHAASTRHVD